MSDTPKATCSRSTAHPHGVQAARGQKRKYVPLLPLRACPLATLAQPQLTQAPSGHVVMRDLGRALAGSRRVTRAHEVKLFAPRRSYPVLHSTRYVSSHSEEDAAADWDGNDTDIEDDSDDDSDDDYVIIM